MKQAIEMSYSFSPRVLVVDNGQSNLQLLETLLNRCGFTVVTAHNGYEAVRRFNKEWFDLVLMDICTPGINGNILAQHIKKFGDDVPVIAVTPSPRLVDNYFDMVVTNPFEQSFLMNSIRYLLM